MKIPCNFIQLELQKKKEKNQFLANQIKENYDTNLKQNKTKKSGKKFLREAMECSARFDCFLSFFVCFFVQFEIPKNKK